MLTSLTLVSFSTAQTKNGVIREGYTMLSQPLRLTAADSVAGFGGHHILTGDSLIVLISNPQKYLQYHTVTSTLAVNSGSGTITVNFYGKVTSGDSWHPIGTDATYTTGATPVTVTGVTAANYNFLRVSFVQSGGTECARLVAFEVRTANAFPYGATRVTGTAGLTVTGGIINLNVSSNNAVNIGTGTTTSTITLGGAGNQTIAIGNGAAVKTVALGSSNTTSVTTLLSGSGGLLLNKDNNQPTNIGTGTSTGLVTIGGGSGTAAINTSVWDITNAGVATGLTGITTSGAVTTGSVIVGIDTCKGIRTAKAVGSLGLLRVTAAATIGGFTGGVAGQTLSILNTANSTLVLKHNGAGTQKMMISGGSDLTLTGQYNSVTLAFDGTYWFITGKGQ